MVQLHRLRVSLKSLATRRNSSVSSGFGEVMRDGRSSAILKFREEILLLATGTYDGVRGRVGVSRAELKKRDASGHPSYPKTIGLTAIEQEDVRWELEHE